MSTKTHEIAADSFAVITWESPELGLDDSDLPSRVGRQFVPTASFAPHVMGHEPVAFRLRDEDDVVHYRGLLRDDPQCEAQSAMSDWGAADTGGFIVEVKRGGKWTMEIG